MSSGRALAAMSSIRERYKAIPTPKYANADLAALKADLAQLEKLKVLLRGNADYLKLKNAIGKVLSRMQPTESKWKNIAEYSVGKTIRPVTRHNSDDEGLSVWTNKYGQQQAKIPQRNWSYLHFLALDIIGYEYMLQIGQGQLPKKDLPLFKNKFDIVDQHAIMTPLA